MQQDSPDPPYNYFINAASAGPAAEHSVNLILGWSVYDHGPIVFKPPRANSAEAARSPVPTSIGRFVPLCTIADITVVRCPHQIR